MSLWTRIGCWLLAAGLLLSVIQSVPALGEPGSAPDRSRPLKVRVLPSGFPAAPANPPLWTVPVEPLGFSAPGPLYLGQRNSLVSLDFIDEDRLLFTFRVPGLIHRELKPGESGQGDERQIKAVVLTLPSGNVEAESLWSVHDRSRYLWMLKDGHFLLRDRNNLQQGDAHLVLKPSLQFPGPLLGLELDPTQQFLVSDSLEPAAASARPGEVDTPAPAAASMTTGDQAASSSSSSGDSSSEQPDLVVRILHRETGQVMLVSRVRTPVHLPINSEGYVESLRGRGEEWTLTLNFFTGGSRILGTVDSLCVPKTDFISQKEILVTACDSSGSQKLVAMTTDGKTLWADLNPDTAIWQILAASPGGPRLVQETLVVSHPISAYEPLGSDDIKGQLVRIFDAATGEVAFESRLSPIFDAGGNAAVSPSGRRIAIINAGAIQVFELPAPPLLPDAAPPKAAR